MHEDHVVTREIGSRIENAGILTASGTLFHVVGPADATRYAVAHYSDVFSKGRSEYAIPSGAVTDPIGSSAIASEFGAVIASLPWQFLGACR